MPDDSVSTTGRINAIESIECTFQELRNGATFVYREIDCCLLNKLYRGHDAIEIFIRLHSIFHLFATTMIIPAILWYHIKILNIANNNFCNLHRAQFIYLRDFNVKIQMRRAITIKFGEICSFILLINHTLNICLCKYLQNY